MKESVFDKDRVSQKTRKTAMKNLILDSIENCASLLSVRNFAFVEKAKEKLNGASIGGLTIKVR